MTLSGKEKATIDRLAHQSRPFFVAMMGDIVLLRDKVAVMQPAEGEVVPDHLTGSFFINTYANNEEPLIHIYEQAQEGDPFTAEMQCERRSTTAEEYKAGVARVIDEMEEGEKVVMARVIAVKSRRTPAEVAAAYFRKLPDTFRFIYNTPQTGLWLGATPELLLQADEEDNTFLTMALAGTRPVSDLPWDDKNMREHAIVRDYIISVLRDTFPQLLLDDYCAVGNMPFGNIEHLCTRIGGMLNGTSPLEMVQALSPTPALCGYPTEKAFLQQMLNEYFDRRCYGGFVGLRGTTGCSAFVNLRSAHAEYLADEGCWLYNVYVGAGILPESNPNDEWRETERKARALLTAIHPDITL